MTKEELTAYKKAEAEYTFNGNCRIDIKDYIDDGKFAVIIDVNPDDPDDISSIIKRRLYRSYGDDYFTYKGFTYYLWEFSRIL